MWPFSKSPEERLLEEIKNNSLIDDLPVQVKVVDGVAVFTGTVQEQRQKTALILTAQNVDKIKSVNADGVVVAGGPTKKPVPAVDTALLANTIKKSLSAHSALADDPIDVSVNLQGVATLRGAVDSDAEKSAAASLAQAVSGITSVDTSGLQVIPDVKELNQNHDGDGYVTYTVKRGDTLSLISKRFYGSIQRDAYMRIANFNGISNPDRIDVGQVLRIPNL